MPLPPLVVIPTYNEKENIERILDEIFGLSEPFHVLVVDDNSPDGTAQIVKDLMAGRHRGRLFLKERPGKMGLGTAYVEGFQWGLGRGYALIGEMDADFSHPPHKLLELKKAIVEGGADVSIGSRYVSGVNVVNWPFSRVVLSYMASVYVRKVTGLPVMDTTAGFVMYRREVLETIDLSTIRFKGYAFQIEMKFRAWHCGYRLKEVPIIFYDRTDGQSKMSGGIVREAVFGVIAMKLRSWFRKCRRTA